MASRNDLVRKILKELGVWQAGQELAPEDYQAVDQELVTKLLAMGRADIYDASVDSLPDEAIDAIARYLSWGYCPTFGIDGDEETRVKTNAAEAVAYLKYLRTNRPTYSRTRAEYF